MVHSSSFRNRFGTVGLGHKQEWNSFVLATQNFWTCSKHSYSPADPTRMRRTLLECIGMDWNDHKWTPEPTRMVHSCLFRSRFGTVGLGHYTAAIVCNNRQATMWCSCHQVYQNSAASVLWCIFSFIQKFNWFTNGCSSIKPSYIDLLHLTRYFFQSHYNNFNAYLTTWNGLGIFPMLVWGYPSY